MKKSRAKPVELHTHLSQQIRKIREQRRLSQDELARLSWDFGLDWLQDTVASIEIGRRRISLEEFLLLRSILECNYQDLFPQDCAVALSPKITIDWGYWTSTDPVWPRLSRKQINASRGRAGEVESVMDYEGRGAGGEGRRLRDAEIKAGRKLGVDPHVIVETALKLWKRPLPDERDHRLTSHMFFTGEGSRTIVDERRTLQAARGHITRQLIEELRKGIKPNMIRSKKRRKQR